MKGSRPHLFVYWRIGADAHERAFGIRVYACPLCLKSFEEEEAISDLTREHVPPKGVGGRELLLTCRDCNSRSGHELDWHACEEKKFTQFVDGQAYPPLSARMGRHAANVELRKVGDVNVIRLLPKNNPPHRLQEVWEEVQEWGDGNEFQLELGRPFMRRRADISWLKSAYLLAFAWLGYRYISGPAMALIRLQIREPDKWHIKTFCAFSESAASPRIAVVQGPRITRGIAVTAYGRIVLLPFFGDDCDFYSLMIEANRKSINIHGRSFAWPDTAMYSLDHAKPEELAAFWSRRR